MGGIEWVTWRAASDGPLAAVVPPACPAAPTSLEPLLVTAGLNMGPSAPGYSYHEVRAVSAARQAELDSA